MKKRELRRYLTKKYQQRQIRYYRSIHGPEFDDERKRQSERAKQHFFVEFLKGNVVLLERNPLKYFEWGVPSESRPLPARIVGRYKKHSFDDCGVAGCPRCSNPRNVWKGRYGAEKTLKEKKSDQQMQSDLEEFVENGNIDCVCRVNSHNPRK